MLSVLHMDMHFPGRQFHWCGGSLTGRDSVLGSQSSCGSCCDHNFASAYSLSIQLKQLLVFFCFSLLRKIYIGLCYNTID